MFGSSSNNTKPAPAKPSASNVSVNNFEVFVAKNTQMTGNISVKGSARIDGKFSGIIFSESDVMIGETGEITANIFAENVTVAGKIEGNIVAKGLLEVLASSSIRGDIRCDKLTVENGAIVRGNIDGLENSNTPDQNALPETAAPQEN